MRRDLRSLAGRRINPRKVVLTLALKIVPADRARGRTVVNRVPQRLPLRALFLHPLAADSFVADLAERVVVADMFRSPETTLMAVSGGAGSKPPGYSGHNFGLSIDLDLELTTRELRMDKRRLDVWMVERGWHCARRDGIRGLDDRHYDYLRAGDQLGLGTRVDPVEDVEQLIVRMYGDALFPSVEECQRMLKRLRMYGGVVDGDPGPLTEEATTIFQRAWNVARDARVVPGALDSRTRRTLAIVTHQRQLEPWPDQKLRETPAGMSDA